MSTDYKVEFKIQRNLKN